MFHTFKKTDNAESKTCLGLYFYSDMALTQHHFRLQSEVACISETYILFQRHRNKQSYLCNREIVYFIYTAMYTYAGKTILYRIS